MQDLLISPQDVDIEKFNDETTKTLNNIVSQLNNVIESQENWLDSVTLFMQKNVLQQKRMYAVEGGILSVVKDNWRKLKMEYREKYDDDFFKWANYYQSSVGTKPKEPKTINNLIRVYKTFFSDDKVAHAEELVIDGEKVEVNLSQVNSTLLLNTVKIAKDNGRIPNDVMEVLVNPKTTVTQLKNTIYEYNNPEVGITQQKIQNKKRVNTNGYIVTTRDGIYWKDSMGGMTKAYDIVPELDNSVNQLKVSKTLLSPLGLQHHYGFDGDELPEVDDRPLYYNPDEETICFNSAEGNFIGCLPLDDAVQYAQEILRLVRENS
jgi:hypothetical protein